MHSVELDRLDPPLENISHEDEVFCAARKSHSGTTTTKSQRPFCLRGYFLNFYLISQKVYVFPLILQHLQTQTIHLQVEKYMCKLGCTLFLSFFLDLCHSFRTWKLSDNLPSPLFRPS